MKKILVEAFGRPEVMRYVESKHSIPNSNEILVENKTMGVNYTDIYTRANSLGGQILPLTPGKEGAGIVLAIGENVTRFSVGDHVTYIETPGAYSEKHVVSEAFAIKLPTEISFEMASSMMLKGLTAQFLIRKTFKVQKKHTILIHAAAGGVGSILTQWSKALGATVIGTVGSKEKAKKAFKQGCDLVINYNEKDFSKDVLEFTKGKGVDVVYDSVGKDTFESSLNCLKKFGYFISFGQASGAIPPFPITKLVEKGSLFATFPSLTDHISNPNDYAHMANEFFDIVKQGKVKIEEPQVFKLSDVVKAHELLESRKAMSSIILVP